MGGPAARAWGLRVYGLESIRVIIASRWAWGGPFCCAREQQDDAQEQTPDNHPNGSEDRTNSRSHESFCRERLLGSIGRGHIWRGTFVEPR